MNAKSLLSYSGTGEESRRSLLRPVQAVILAGGRGSRLKPLTDERPKAMVEIHGKPFLGYQIEQLRDQGFERILLLLGYLPEVIQEYCGDGAKWGVKIEYSISAADDETGRRLKLAESRLDPYFLLLYCDNYWPMRMETMWPKFAAAQVPMMMTVYTNKDGYTRNSIRVDPDGYIAIYDKSATAPDLQGVEISYALVNKSVLQRLPEENVSLESALYVPLARERQLLAYTTDHRYYSVGSLQKLPLTENFFARRPFVFLDRDGVLNRKPPRAHYVRHWNEFQWLPGAKEALAMLKGAGYRIVIVSNQAGVARGAMTAADLSQIHLRMRLEAEASGGGVDAIYYCPHDWNAGCECRKPSPGLFFMAQRELDIDLSRAVFIGDDERDKGAAERAGCGFMEVSEAQPLVSRVRQLLYGRATEGDQAYAEACIDHRP